MPCEVGHSSLLEYYLVVKVKSQIKQECIPVGCVPPAAVAVCWGSVCLSACWDTPPSPQVWAWTPAPL